MQKSLGYLDVKRIYKSKKMDMEFTEIGLTHTFLLVIALMHTFLLVICLVSFYTKRPKIFLFGMLYLIFFHLSIIVQCLGETHE